MNLVVPIFTNDAHLLPYFVRAIEKFPPGVGYKLIVVTDPNSRSLADDLIMGIGKFFEEPSVYFIQNTARGSYGWPSAMNSTFGEVAHYMGQQGDPWLYFEMDSTPLREYWMDVIKAHYFRTIDGRRLGTYMGAKTTVLVDIDKVVADGDVSMGSCAVYSQDTYKLPSLQAATDSHTIPYFEFLRWQTGPHAQFSGVIQNNWRTGNYRYENGIIVCDSLANWPHDVHFNDIIRKEAVVLHGCKDGTLSDILTRDGQVVSRKAYNLEIEGSIPSPAIIEEEDEPVGFNEPEDFGDIPQNVEYPKEDPKNPVQGVVLRKNRRVVTLEFLIKHFKARDILNAMREMDVVMWLERRDWVCTHFPQRERKPEKRKFSPETIEKLRELGKRSIVVMREKMQKKEELRKKAAEGGKLGGRKRKERIQSYLQSIGSNTES